MIKIKDINGLWQVFDDENIMEALAAGDIFAAGLSLESIIALKYEYERRGGPYPVTPKSVKFIFKTEHKP